jgi:glycosyltransferase involved in cell wall biosynthesis
MTDGFPTQAAADAMSSGCLLVSANPLGDHRVFEPGVHYIECQADTEALRDVLRGLARDRQTMRRIAETGSARVRERMDVRLGVAAKLELMGLTSVKVG